MRIDNRIPVLKFRVNLFGLLPFCEEMNFRVILSMMPVPHTKESSSSNKHIFKRKLKIDVVPK
jgi:hypothetical protein